MQIFILKNRNINFFGLLLHAGLVLSVAYAWRLVLVVFQSQHQPSSGISGQSSLVTLPLGLLSLPTISAGPTLCQLLALEAGFVNLSESMIPGLILLLGVFVG